MRKGRRVLIGLLCMVLLLTNTLSSELRVFAAENANDSHNMENIVDEAAGSASSDEGVENKDSQPDDQEEESDQETTPEEPESENPEQEESENKEAEEDGGKDETDDSEGGEEQIISDHMEENTGDEKEVDTKTASSMSAEERLKSMRSDGDIDWGTDGDIAWVIDANGKLTVEGSGDFTRLYSVYPPWYNNRQYIISAEINIEGMTDASFMFYECSKLQSVDFSKFHTGNVTSMYDMFRSCESLQNLDLSNFDTSQVTNMSIMFYGCSSLQSLDLSNFDTSQVTNMGGMFWRCSSLQSLDLSNFDTRQVTIMRLMFEECSSLQSLDLSNFDASNVTDASDMFSFDYNLLTIYTPYNLEVYAKLPGISSDIWYRSDGTTIKALPENLDYSVELGKNYIPKENHLTECAGGTINGRGVSYGRVRVVDNGELIKNKKVRWKFDTDSAEYHTAETDANGYFMLQSPSLSYDEEGTNEYVFKAAVEYYTGSTWITMPKEYTMEVKVEPLTVLQKWQLKTGASLEVGIGATIGGEVGPAKVKASLAEIGVAASGGGTMSISHGYSGGKRKLTLLQTISQDVASKAKVGPAFSASVGAVKGNAKLIGVKGERALGNSITYGLVIDDYDPADLKQLEHVGKFVATAQQYNTGDVMLGMLLALWGYDDYYLKGTDIETSLSNGASVVGIGVSGTGDNTIGFSTDVASAGYARTYSTGATVNDYDCTYGYEAEIASDVKGGLLNFGIEGNKTKLEGLSLASFGEDVKNVGVSFKTDLAWNLIEAEYTNTTYNSWGTLFRTNTNSKEISFSVTDSNALQRLETVDRIKKFANPLSNTILLSEDYIAAILDDIRENANTLDYKVAHKEKSMVKLPIAAGLAAILDVGLEVEYAGSNEISYVECTGFTEGDSLYVTAEMENTQEDIDNAKMELSEFLTAPLQAACENMNDFLVDVKGKAVDGVKSGMAWIGEKISGGMDWMLHIKSIKSDRKSRTASVAESYEISTYMTASTETMETPGTSMTVGDPYMIYVTDDAGKEVTDFTDHPLVLKLGYDDVSLTAAGVTDDTLSALGIYMYSEEKCGYVYLGGEIDAANQQVMVDVTKPGQYILAADNLAPSVYDIYVSDTSTRPTITAFLSELSGLSQFSMKIDGVEYINETTLDKYMDRSSGRFVYKIMQDLSAGEHTLTFTATDSRGNATKEPITFVFVVDSENDDPEVFEVSFDLQGHGAALEEYQTYKNIPAGSIIAEPPKPQADGYVFMGWYKDAECTEKWDFETDIVQGNMTLYAGWKENNLSGEDPDDPIDPEERNGIHIVGLKESYEYTGAKIIPDIKVYDYSISNKIPLVPGIDYTIKYKDNVKVSTVDKKATVIVTGKGNYAGKGQEGYFVIVENKSIPEEELLDLKGAKLAKIDPVSYNTKARYPDFTLTLKNQTPITYTYSDNDGYYVQSGTTDRIKVNVAVSNNTNKGTATILLTGKKGSNNKATTLKKIFKIKALDISNAVITTDSATYGVKGAVPLITVTIKVDVDGKEVTKTLIPGVDYTAKYTTNKKAGKNGIIKVTGKGNYTNKAANTNFDINTLAMTDLKIAVAAYEGIKANKVKAIVLDPQGNALKASQYTVEVSKNEQFSEIRSDKLNAGEEIYVRAAAKDTVNLTENTKTKAVKVKVGKNFAKAKVRLKKDDSTNKTITKTYTGGRIELNKNELEVTMKGVSGEITYEIVGYTNNIKKGTATAILQGTGEYTGTKPVKFKIIAKSMTISSFDKVKTNIKNFINDLLN